MSSVGFGKIFDEYIVKTVEKTGIVKKVEEIFSETTEKGSISKKGTALENEGIKTINKEALKLSHESMAKGKLSNATKIDFVKESSEITSSTISAPAKRNPMEAIKQANRKYAEKTPELVALKYKNMAESPFAFFRSTNYIFYGDIAAEKALNSKVKIPLLGDLHLENIGTYKTVNDKIAVGLNDFDDAVIGPYTWEIARCATSIRLASKEAGIGQKESKDLVEGFVKDYLKNLKKLQDEPQKLEKPLTDSKYFGKHVEKTVEKAGDESQKDFIKEFTKDDKFRLSETVKPVSDKTRKNITEAIKAYAKGHNEPKDFFEVKDAAFHIAGKGSLGRERYIVLIEGKSKGKADNIILELKEATQPAAANVLGKTKGNQAERVINSANYFMPSASPYLGVTKIGETDFFVRELSPTSKKVDLAKLNKESEMKDFLETVSEVVARAHAKSGQTKQILDDAGSKSGFAEKIGDFADDYLQRVEKDFKKFIGK